MHAITKGRLTRNESNKTTTRTTEAATTTIIRIIFRDLMQNENARCKREGKAARCAVVTPASLYTFFYSNPRHFFGFQTSVSRYFYLSPFVFSRRFIARFKPAVDAAVCKRLMDKPRRCYFCLTSRKNCIRIRGIPREPIPG